MVALDTTETDNPDVGGIAADRLRSLIERIERLEEERKALGSDIKDMYAEAKSAGFLSRVHTILSVYVQTLTRSMSTQRAYLPDVDTSLVLLRSAACRLGAI